MSGIGLLLVGLNHYTEKLFFGMKVIKLDLFISMVVIAAETLVMFFFVGTGVGIKDFIKANPDTDLKFHERSLSIKRKLYPPTMVFTILFIIMIIFDGLFVMRQVSGWWFTVLYIISVYYFIKSVKIQHLSFKENVDIFMELADSE